MRSPLCSCCLLGVPLGIDSSAVAGEEAVSMTRALCADKEQQ